MKKFTLIELLVIVAIIGILMTILLPSLSKARQASLAGVCVSNMKQVNLGITLFSDENNGYLPGKIWNSVYAYYDDNNHLEGQIEPASTGGFCKYVTKMAQKRFSSEKSFAETWPFWEIFEENRNFQNY